MFKLDLLFLKNNKQTNQKKKKKPLVNWKYSKLHTNLKPCECLVDWLFSLMDQITFKPFQGCFLLYVILYSILFFPRIVVGNVDYKKVKKEKTEQKKYWK